MKSSIATGNWSTAGTWGTVRNTPTLHATSAITISGSTFYTLTFTAPNTTNAVTGVWLFLSTPGSLTITVTLQESTVDTAAVKAITTTQGTSTNAAGYYYFEFATPYTYTTTSAGAYRFKVVGSSVTNNAVAAADSGGSNMMFWAVDDATGVPGAEPVLIGHTVTVDGSQTVGSGADTATIGTSAHRSIGWGVQVAYGGTLQWDTAASATLTCKGHFGSTVNGIVNMGTVASPYPSSYVATLSLDENGTSGNYGIACMPSATFIGQGQAKTTGVKFSSGLGTAASPLIVDTATNWAVNDKIEVAGGVYNQTEYRYIITVNSTTSFVVSSTLGGAENALVNTHATTQPVINLTRNVVVNTTSTTHAGYAMMGPAAVGQSNWDDVRFENIGATSAQNGKQGIFMSINLGAGISSTYGEMDNCISDNSLFSGFCVQNSQTTQTFSGLVVANSAATGNNSGAFALQANCANKTLTDCYVVDVSNSGVFMTTAVNTTFTRMNIWCANKSGTGAYGGIQTSNPVSVTWNDCIIQSCRTGINFGGASRFTFNNLHCGDYFTNTTDISCVTGNSNFDIHFEGSTFGSATFVSNYANQGFGSKISFQNLNGTATDNRTYEATGTTRSTGTGLADTNVRTASSLAWRIAPENNTIGMVKDIMVLAKANSAVSIFGFLQKNAAFGTSTLQVDLLLPGEITSSATQTMGNGTDWQVFSLAADYSGSVDLYATLRITAITATASAYVYLDDIYNGTNKITAMDVFNKGEPSPIMFEQLGDANAIWAVLVSTLTTSGTIGYFVTKLLTLAKFLGLK